MEKAVLFQKQIRDNAQDLHSYMSDLSSWEKDMKRKESELTGEPIEQDLPPVRSKAKKSKPVNSKPKKEKKLAGFDYTAWDKFDAEKACELVDEEDIAPTSYDSKMSAQQKQEKLKEEAHEEKEKGNTFVKLQKWDDAIACYTRAIALNKSDAIYFANRGLCHLKKENLHAAEADCTRALALDPKYVKALQRRSCAREALGSLRSSASDLREVLEIEPNNLAVRKQLVALTQRMGTKGPNSKSSPATTPSTEEAPTNGLLHPKTAGGDTKKAVINETDKSPTVPPSIEVSGQVLPVVIPPHLRSKKPLVRIPVMEIPLGVSNTKTTPKSPVDLLQKQVLIHSPDDSIHLVEKESKIIKDTTKLSNGLGENHEQSQNIINGKQDINDVTKKVTSIATKAVTQSVMKTITKDALNSKVLNGIQNIESIDIKSLQLDEANTPLQVPKSSVQFISQWRMLRGRDKERSKYLRAIPPNQLPTIFQNFLESDTLSEMVATLHSGEDFVQANSNALPYLQNLAAVKRFSALAMFLSKEDKNGILEILQRCQKANKCSKQEFAELKTKYEL